MKRYIKINNQNEIIDVFLEHQIMKFDGTEIFLDEVDKPIHKLNGKSISTEEGLPIFKWDGKNIIEDSETVEILEAMKVSTIQEIKAEAQKRIFSLIPGESDQERLIKEINMLATIGGYQDILLAGGSLTLEQQAQYDGIKLIWETIKSIREASNLIEIEVQSLATVADTVTYKISDNLNWP